VGSLDLSIPVLLFGSYWGIGQLDTSLAHVFGLRIKKHRQTRKNPLFRQLSLLIGGMVLMVLFIALLVGGVISRHLPFPQMEFLPYLPPIICLFVLTILLQHLPRLHVKWRHAFLGSLISTTLWWLAKWGFTVYLNHTFTWGIMYGSMLSMVAGLTFLYYSSAIFLLGAEITAAFYRHETGSTTGLKVPTYLREPKASHETGNRRSIPIVLAVAAGGDFERILSVFVDLVAHGAEGNIQLLGAMGPITIQCRQGGNQPEAFQFRE